MIDITNETLITLAQAARLVPPAHGGKRCHLSTVQRWIITGTRGPSGEVVRLEGIRIGSRWFTTREAIMRWSTALTPHLDAAPPAPPRTPERRRRASERAAVQLDKIGI
jgi:hypothetical protein